MFLLALAVSHLPQVLPPLVLALLTGLNASAVGPSLSPFPTFSLSRLSPLQVSSSTQAIN